LDLSDGNPTWLPLTKPTQPINPTFKVSPFHAATILVLVFNGPTVDGDTTRPKRTLSYPCPYGLWLPLALESTLIAWGWISICLSIQQMTGAYTKSQQL
jgi:hypothetical protein